MYNRIFSASVSVTRGPICQVYPNEMNERIFYSSFLPFYTHIHPKFVLKIKFYLNKWGLQ